MILGFLLAVPVHSQSLKDRLVGSWTLVSWTRQVGGAEEPGLFGKDAVGQILYSADGRMCMTLMSRSRSNFKSPDFRGGTPEEKAAAYDSFQSYCGRYEVNAEQSYVLHKLESSSYPNWTRTEQKRFVKIEGGRLTLTSPPVLSGGREIVGVLVWERK